MIIAIPATHRDNWADATLLLTSLRMYAPDHAVRFYYTGHEPPGCFPGWWKAIPQLPTNASFGDACKQILDDCDPEDGVLILNDDTVLTPTTIPLLEADIKYVYEENPTKMAPGLVGLRSNCIAGCQNIRWHAPSDPPNADTGILQYPSENTIVMVEQVFGVAFWAKVSTLRSVSDDWTHLHWFSDNLLSYDLKLANHQHFISRAYVHHHGSRSGGSAKAWHRKAVDWLWEHRPDFAQLVDHERKITLGRV